MARVVTAVAADDPGMTLGQAVWLLTPGACASAPRSSSLTGVTPG